jgi:predicted Fe-Mo cluster-binding NifX family protein
MRVAITSTGNSLESDLDRRFARCNYFVIFDNQSGSVEFIPNPNKNLEENAGPASVELLVSRKTDKIISGEFGTKIKAMLDSLKIQLIILPDTKRNIGQIIELLNH